MKIREIKMYLSVVDYLESAAHELIHEEHVDGKRRKVCQCGAVADPWLAKEIRHADDCLAADLLDKVKDIELLIEGQP